MEAVIILAATNYKKLNF